MTAAPPLIIEVSALRKSYPLGGKELHILKGIDLQVERGEMVAIIGASGSGKSTLMNIIGLMDRPTEGNYRLDGHDTGVLSDEELSRLRNERIGFVFQSFNLIPYATAFENALLPTLYSHKELGDLGERARTILSDLGLGHRIHSRPNQLSGGEQQRVAIARALMNKPDLILADEPTGALDSATSEEIISILKDLNSRGSTVIVITHDPQVAEQCSRQVRIADGQIV